MENKTQSLLPDIRRTFIFNAWAPHSPVRNNMGQGWARHGQSLGKYVEG